MHEIETSLYLGSLQDADNERLIRKTGIKNIVQVLDNPTYNKRFKGIKYYYVRLRDEEDENLIDELPDAIYFINRQILKGEKVLVHCVAGVSRSPAIVIAYLMAKHNIFYEEAYGFVKSKRDFIQPNLGFEKQLIEYGYQRLEEYL
ncbi:unnamed protein product [Blepharisma stoltei]|uniref:protein-tyrosine-phosphatase n=1 Tax=Blepharisma stoltei TaxID=1481888 RepID=A0AAU9JMF7_9CILI|nr:unnamed protein product [Blepharisma stoltei]